MRIREGLYWTSVGSFTATLISLVSGTTSTLAGAFFTISYAFLLAAAYPRNGR